MLLQIAFDIGTEQEILNMIKCVENHVDILEIGTPILLRYGLNIIKKVRATHPTAKVLADAKIADSGRIESEMMFDAGADIVTVLGAMNEETVAAVVSCARERGKETMCDLIGITDYSAAAPKLNRADPDFVCSHIAVDVVSEGLLRKHFTSLKSAGIKAKLALAGGVRIGNVKELIGLKPDILIVGRSITESENARETAKLFKETIYEYY